MSKQVTWRGIHFEVHNRNTIAQWFAGMSVGPVRMDTSPRHWCQKTSQASITLTVALSELRIVMSLT
eukprot:6095778-Amphidinium_carterae.1